MDVAEYLVELKKRAEERTWHDDLCHDVNQVFAAAGNWSGLQDFYEQALSEALTGDDLRRVKIESIEPFEAGIRDSLAQAKELLSTDSQVKALYFEYFYDGAEWCQGDLYLPNMFKKGEQDWASHWDHVIDGPNVHQYLNYDPEFDFERYTEYAADHYVHAMFLAACGRAWDQAGIKGYPFGFAKHDGPIVYLA